MADLGPEMQPRAVARLMLDAPHTPSAACRLIHALPKATQLLNDMMDNPDYAFSTGGGQADGGSD